jgi:hypothetical protein
MAISSWSQLKRTKDIIVYTFLHGWNQPGKVMSVYVPRWGKLAQYLLFDSQKNRGTKVQSLISRAG